LIDALVQQVPDLIGDSNRHQNGSRRSWMLRACRYLRTWAEASLEGLRWSVADARHIHQVPAAVARPTELIEEL